MTGGGSSGVAGAPRMGVLPSTCGTVRVVVCAPPLAGAGSVATQLVTC